MEDLSILERKTGNTNKVGRWPGEQEAWGRGACQSAWI